jgi:hypothetical protein
VLPIFVLSLEGKYSKVATAADERVGDEPTATIVVTGPDSKDFTM